MVSSIMSHDSSDGLPLAISHRVPSKSFMRMERIRVVRRMEKITSLASARMIVSNGSDG